MHPSKICNPTFSSVLPSISMINFLSPSDKLLTFRSQSDLLRSQSDLLRSQSDLLKMQKSQSKSVASCLEIFQVIKTTLRVPSCKKMCKRKQKNTFSLTKLPMIKQHARFGINFQSDLNRLNQLIDYQQNQIYISFICMLVRLALLIIVIVQLVNTSWIKQEQKTNQSVPKYKASRNFVFKNQCNQKIWIGGFGVPLPTRTGWQMAPGSQETLQISSTTVAIRFWARTGCAWKDNKFVCETGDCGAPLNNFGIQCKGITGQSPSTLVELTLSSTGFPDFYDLSNVDGNNLGVRFGPIQGTYTKVDNPDLGKFNCGKPGCTIDQSKCPKQLTLEKSSGKYCMSICAAVFNNEQVQKYPDILGPIASDDMKKDLVCCACGAGTGGCTDPNSHFCCSPFDPRAGIGGKCYVENWPKPSQNFDRYDRVFKNQCQEAYSWQFDDISSTYQCIDGDYEIVFCP